MCNRTAEGFDLDVVGEAAAPVDLDDREPLTVAPLELIVARDVDAFIRDADAIEHVAGAIAEVAPLRVEQNDSRDRGHA